MEPFQTNQGCAAKKVPHMVRGVISAFRKAILHYLPGHWVATVKRSQDKIKRIKFMQSQKRSIRHLARRGDHTQDE